MCSLLDPDHPSAYLAVHPIYVELRERSERKMAGVVRASMAMCTTVYMLTAVFGFLLFGQDIMGDVLANFDHDLSIPLSKLVSEHGHAVPEGQWMGPTSGSKFACSQIGGQAGTSTTSLGGQAGLASWCNSLFCKVRVTDTEWLLKMTPEDGSCSGVLRPMTSCELGVCVQINDVVRLSYALHLLGVFPLIHYSFREVVDSMVFPSSPPLAESPTRFYSITAVLLSLTFIGSVFVPNIWVAFEFTGATAAVSLGFTFPALIAWRWGAKVAGSRER
jgi:amino acid permease